MTTPILECEWPEAVRIAYELGTVRPVHVDERPLTAAIGATLAHPVIAAELLPADDTSAMDGWATGSPTGPWRIVGSSLAGHPFTAPIAAAEAVQIATGAVPPPGSWGIVRREYTTVEGDTIRVRPEYTTVEPAARGHVRPAGAEARPGDVLIEPGTVVTPAHVGLAAMAGHDRLTVYREPTASLLISGDEVVRSGSPGRGLVRDALGPQLPAFAGSYGISTIDIRFLADAARATRQALEQAEADLIITTGGTAAGAADHLHDALGRLGATILIDTIAMRPGHPTMLAVMPDGRPVVGLPGNPLSAMVAVMTVLRPLAFGLTRRPLPPMGTAPVSDHVSAPAAEHRIVPVTQSADGTLTETNWLGSGMLRGLASAHALAVVSPAGAQRGDHVPFLRLPWSDEAH